MITNPSIPEDWRQECEQILAEYSRPVAHLRERLRARQFDIVFGTGISRPLGFPDSAIGQDVLIDYLADRTCLLVGTSLSHWSLQQGLSRVVRHRPGHVHYFVRFIRDGSDLTPDDRAAEFQANFSNFNLVTLFLTERGVTALAMLVGADEAAIRSFAASDWRDRGTQQPLQFVYYLIGGSGVGKTTVLRHFDSLRQNEEWLDPLLDEMTGPFRTLNEEEKLKVDRWVDAQWVRKTGLIAAAGAGIDLVDRGPLDALAYVPIEARAARAAMFNKSFRDSGSSLVSGQVIRLRGDDHVVFTRARQAFRSHPLEGMGGISWQQQEIGAIYEASDDDPSTVCIDGLTPDEVARKVAQIIYTQPYRPDDLQERLVRFVASSNE